MPVKDRTRHLPLLLGKTRVDRDTGEVARHQELVELNGTCHRLDEDHDLHSVSMTRRRCARTKADLVELEGIKQLVELPVLANFLKLDVVLLETVERELGLVIDEDFEGLAIAISTALTRRQRTKNARSA